MRPSALAVFRLIANVYLLDAYTGRSAGFAFKDAIYLAGCLPILIEEVWSVGHQTANRDEMTARIDSR